ncbi:MAG: phosphoribosylformylglycinamidine synthase subunit PurL [Pseudomonadota bacterium]|nr:phosphoribosylformylglycinamidine synthase subunit PurL [Pseudomonadota bacterium]
MNALNITPDIIAKHGLSDEEYATLLNILSREPNMTELGIFSVMWSEHCSYKSSRKWLKTLPTEGPQVIQGPGENAGVVDIGGGRATVFKIESHNHPSFIEPYQGAATGVGGILRDIFTMGARPIANLNALRFGAPDHSRTRHLLSGVVAGIGGYGNCIGVPTVAGEINFHPAYNGNILVNAMTVGIADADKIFLSAAAGMGNPVVYVGSKTGRDGIHGATMASAEFSKDSEDKRPTVQVGDPFTEKLLLEACLELMTTNSIIAIQDMGAAGLTCSSVEMADKGGVGIELDLDAVPAREEEMTPYELMLSESQERMLMVLKPEAEETARRIFEKWGVDFAVVGRITDTGALVVKEKGQTVVDIPVAPLVEASPEYDRPYDEIPAPAIVLSENVPIDKDIPASLEKLMASPDLCSKRWIWEQYDHMVMADTVQGPGGDAAVVRIHGTEEGLAVTTDCTPRYCKAHPESGGRQAVVEAWRNLTAVGATPLAITNNLNFGNPERRSIMGQFVGCVKGIGTAAAALDFPIVSGNVSLYNETNGEAILPTPVIGGVGHIADIVAGVVGIALPEPGQSLVLIGDTEGWLGASLYLREICHLEEGAPPPVDLDAEQRNGSFVRARIGAGQITACHDLSDGGLLVALTEMALAGSIGVEIEYTPKMPAHAWYFGEDQGRYLCATCTPDHLLAEAKNLKVPAILIGRTGGSTLNLPNGDTICLSGLRSAHEGWLPEYMARM